MKRHVTPLNLIFFYICREILTYHLKKSIFELNAINHTQHFSSILICSPFLTVGYVKTTAVEIDFNSLKNRHPQQAYAPEVYDDIDVVSADKRYGITYAPSTSARDT